MGGGNAPVPHAAALASVSDKAHLWAARRSCIVLRNGNVKQFSPIFIIFIFACVTVGITLYSCLVLSNPFAMCSVAGRKTARLVNPLSLSLSR